MDQTILDVRRLRVAYKGYPAVNDVSFHIDRGEILGVVGESGCGKSLAALTLMGLQPNIMKASGDVVFRSKTC